MSDYVYDDYLFGEDDIQAETGFSTICIGFGALILGVTLWLVCSQLREEYLQSDPKLQELKQMCLPIHPDVKDVQLFKGKKSYTINKKKIYICLFDENGEYYGNNTLIYVFLHELSHFLNKGDVGHTEQFHRIFEDILVKATDLGIYDPSIPVEENYCMYND